MKRFAKMIAATMFGAAMMLAVLEGGARLIEPEPKYPGIDRFAFLKYDAYRAWRNTPAWPLVDIDSEGVRQTTGEGPSVLCLGDSTTFGIWWDGEGFHYDSYPAKLAKCGFDVTNKGVLGWTSWHVARQLQLETERYDAIVVRVGWNDHMGQGARRLVKAENPLEYWLNKCAIGRIGILAKNAGETTNKDVRAVALFDYRENMHTICRLAKERAEKVILCEYELSPNPIPGRVIWIHAGGLDTDAKIRASHAEYQAVLREVAEEEGVTVMEETFTAPWHPEDPVHPMGAGYQELALTVARALQTERVAAR